MCARELPVACQGAEGDVGGARSPLKAAQLESLRDAFGQVPDPRSATSRRHPLRAMLGLIALELLMGARDVLDIWRKAACLSPRQREAIGLCVQDKQSGRLTMPGYDALNDWAAGVSGDRAGRRPRGAAGVKHSSPPPRRPVIWGSNRKPPEVMFASPGRRPSDPGTGR